MRFCWNWRSCLDSVLWGFLIFHSQLWLCNHWSFAEPVCCVSGKRHVFLLFRHIASFVIDSPISSGPNCWASSELKLALITLCKLVFSSFPPLSLSLSSGAGSFAVLPPVRHYARAAKKKTTGTRLRCHHTIFWHVEMLAFHPNVFLSSRPWEPAQWSSSNNAEDGLYSRAPRSDVNIHLYRTLHGMRKQFIINLHSYIHCYYISSNTGVFSVNRTDDIVKRLLSLELASHVSSRVPLDRLVMFRSAFLFCNIFDDNVYVSWDATTPKVESKTNR